MKKDWEIKKLGDICEFRRGLTYSKNDEVENSKNAVLRSNNIDLITNQLDLSEIKYISDKIKIDDTKKVKLNSLLICTANGSKAHLGKVALIDDDYGFAFGGFMGLLIPSENIYPRFFYYALISDNYKRFIKSLSDGANINNLKFQDLSNFEIPVPPLEEQKRIVKILDEKFAQLEAIKTNAQTNLQNAKDLFQSQLKKIFNNKDLKKKKLSDLCELISGYAFDSKGYTSNDEDTLLICGDNIMHCSFRWETVKKWPKEQYNDLKRFELKEYDIVLAMDRPWIKSGLKISKITENELPSLLVQRTAAIRTTRKILSEYLYYALQEESFSKYLVDQQTGAGVPHISGKQILNFEVGIPLSPSTRSEDLELRSIVKELDSLSEKVKALCAIYENQIADCEELKKSLLAKAFEGNL